MTVSATNASSGPYTGNGSTIAFPFTFRVETAAEAYLEVNGAQSPATITLNVDGNGKLTGGGAATAASPPIVGATVYVRSTPSFQQNISFVNNGAFLPSTVEEGFDRAAERSIYLLGLYNTASALATAASAAVAGAVAAATAAVQAAINSAVFIVTSATGQTVSTRTLLAGISSPITGQRAYLAEAGREGWFQFNSANLSTQVTADVTYQGLYVAPTAAPTGASGAWVRQVPGSIYFGTWWGASAAFGVNNHLPLQVAADLIPPGATLVPPNESFTVSGSVILRQTGLKLLGAGATEFIHNAATAAFPVIQLARSDCEVAFLTVTGKPTNLSAANPSCIIVSHNNTSYSGGLTPITNLKVHDVHCRNSSLPISTFGYPIPGVGVSPVSGLDIYNVVLETNALGIELFTSDNVDFHDFRISYFESVNAHNGANTVLPGIRILGCKTVRVHDGQVDGYDTGNGTAHEGLRFSAANSDGTNINRRSNQDVVVERVRFTNFFGAVTVDECRGDCIVRQCSFWRDPTDTVVCDAIVTNATVTSFGMLQKVGRFVFDGNNVTGWSRLINYGGNFGQITIKNSVWLGNSVTVSGINYLMAYNVSAGPKLTEFINNQFVVPAGVGFTITAGSGEIVRVFGNTIGEGSPTETAIPNGFGNIGSGTGAGTFLASNNWTYPVGTRAARIAWADNA